MAVMPGGAAIFFVPATAFIFACFSPSCGFILSIKFDRFSPALNFP